MGNCIGRCVCEIGKCFCCDCFVLKQSASNTFLRRKSGNKSPAFTLRRQNSSNTIEFENLMFDLDLPDVSSSIVKLQPKGFGSWLNSTDTGKDIDRSFDSNRLLLREMDFYRRMTNNGAEGNDKDKDATELPIIYPLSVKNVTGENQCFKLRGNTSDRGERMSLGASSRISSVGELQWENEIIVTDEFVAPEQNGNELEWDHYEEENMNFNVETEQLINEIEEMTRNTLEFDTSG